jgi:hypothetical protein
VHNGSCHCGRVTFSVATSPTKAVRCNCSYCVRRGWFTGYATTVEFKLISGKDELRSYQFGNRTATNYFCGTCGIHTHFYGTYGGRTHYAFSIACLDDIDIDDLNVEHIDGKSF